MAIDRASFVFGLEWVQVVMALWGLALVLLAIAVILLRHSAARNAGWTAAAVGFGVVVWSFFSFGRDILVRNPDGTESYCAYAASASPSRFVGSGSCEQAAVVHLLLTVGLPALVVMAAATVVGQQSLLRLRQRRRRLARARARTARLPAEVRPKG